MWTTLNTIYNIMTLRNGFPVVWVKLFLQAFMVTIAKPGFKNWEEWSGCTGGF